MKITLLNNSSHEDNYLKSIIRFVIKDIRNEFNEDFSVEFSDIYFNEDKEGNRTYDKTVDWDGTAWNDNRVWVVLKPDVEFPIMYWVTEQLKGKYQRGQFIENVEEFLVSMAAHEIRHIWQWQNPWKKILGEEYGADAETDADLFASIQLNRWRAAKDRKMKKLMRAEMIN